MTSGTISEAFRVDARLTLVGQALPEMVTLWKMAFETPLKPFLDSSVIKPPQLSADLLLFTKCHRSASVKAAS